MNNDRATSRTMLKPLLIVCETIDVTGILVYAQYIPSEKNGVPDKLSRVRSGESLVEASEYFGFEAKLVIAGIEVNKLLRSLARVAYRAAEKGMPSISDAS